MSSLGHPPYPIPSEKKVLTYSTIKYDARGIYYSKLFRDFVIGTLNCCPYKIGKFDKFGVLKKATF